MLAPSEMCLDIELLDFIEMEVHQPQLLLGCGTGPATIHVMLRLLYILYATSSHSQGPMMTWFVVLFDSS